MPIASQGLRVVQELMAEAAHLVVQDHGCRGNRARQRLRPVSAGQRAVEVSLLLAGLVVLKQIASTAAGSAW